MVRRSIGFFVVAVVAVSVLSNLPTVYAKDADANKSTQKPAGKIAGGASARTATPNPEEVKLGSPELTAGIRLHTAVQRRRADSYVAPCAG